MLENWGDQGCLPGLGHLPCAEGSIEQHHKARCQHVSWRWIIALRSSYHVEKRKHTIRRSRMQPWYRRPVWPLRSICIVSRQSLYLLDPPSTRKPSSEKPRLEMPTDCLRGRRLNHRLGGPVGGGHVASFCDGIGCYRQREVALSQGCNACIPMAACGLCAL